MQDLISPPEQEALSSTISLRLQPETQQNRHLHASEGKFPGQPKNLLNMARTRSSSQSTTTRATAGIRKVAATKGGAAAKENKAVKAPRKTRKAAIASKTVKAVMEGKKVKTGKADAVSKATKAGQAGKTGKATKAGKTGKTGNAGKVGKVGKAAKNGAAEKPSGRSTRSSGKLESLPHMEPVVRKVVDVQEEDDGDVTDGEALDSPGSPKTENSAASSLGLGAVCKRLFTESQESGPPPLKIAAPARSDGETKVSEEISVRAPAFSGSPGFVGSPGFSGSPEFVGFAGTAGSS